MSTSNGFNSNSLYALEYSLLGHTQAYHLSESLAAKAEVQNTDDEVPDDDEAPEAQALDWEAEGFSQDFDWDDEAYGFEVEDDLLPEEQDPLSQSNSLYALEQSVFGAPAPSAATFALEDDLEPEPVESQAFDWDEAIELTYEESADPTPEEMADSFDWLPTEENSGFGLENDPPTYEVEAFEVDEDAEGDEEDLNVTSQTHRFAVEQATVAADTHPKASPEAIAHESDSQEPANLWGHSPQGEPDPPAASPALNQEAQSQAYELDPDAFTSEDEAWINSQAYELSDDQDEAIAPTPPVSSSDAIPVQATVVNPSVPPTKSAEPAEALDFDFDEFDREPLRDRSADAEAFAADLQAILRGEKLYEPPAEALQLDAEPPAPTKPAAAPAPAATPARSQAQSAPPKKPSGHDFFDQMAHATAFDLGTFSLEQTFDEFDAILSEEDSTALSYDDEEPQPKAVLPQAPQSHEAEAIAQSLEWDEDDIAADVEALSVDDWEALQLGLDDSDDEDFATPYPQAMGAPKKKAVSIPKITGAELKQRYWHQISRGGTATNPNEVSGYYWSGPTNQETTQFQKVGTPTTPDQFGVYQQYVQHSSGVAKKDPSTFFPDAWEEKHFDALFELAAQQPGFKPDSDSKLTILGAFAGDEQYKGMQVFFIPSKKGGDRCIPNYLLKKDPSVKEQLRSQKLIRNNFMRQGQPPVASVQPSANQEEVPMSQEASLSSMEDDDFDSLDLDVYNAFEIDDEDSFPEEMAAESGIEDFDVPQATIDQTVSSELAKAIAPTPDSSALGVAEQMARIYITPFKQPIDPSLMAMLQRVNAPNQAIKISPSVLQSLNKAPNFPNYQGNVILEYFADKQWKISDGVRQPTYIYLTSNQLEVHDSTDSLPGYASTPAPQALAPTSSPPNTNSPQGVTTGSTPSSRPRGVARQDARHYLDPSDKPPSESEWRFDIDLLSENIFGSEEERRDGKPFQHGEWSGRLEKLWKPQNNPNKYYYGTTAKIGNDNFFICTSLVKLTTFTNHLSGRVYQLEPVKPNTQWSLPNCTVLVLSGSHGSSEQYTGGIAQKYLETGLVKEVIAINYRGFGGSIPVNATPIEGTYTTSEKSRSRLPLPSALYDDAIAMFNFALPRLVAKQNNLDLVIHGYSLGGAVAGDLAKKVEEQNYRIKGLVLDRAMESLVKAGQAKLGNKIVGKVGGDIAAKVFNDDMDIVPKLETLRKDLPILTIIANDDFKEQNRKLLNKIKAMGFTRVSSSDSGNDKDADHENHNVVLGKAQAELRTLLQ